MADEPDAQDTDFDRRALIESVIAAELERQALEGAQRIDVAAMADAIEAALAANEPAEPDFDDGRRPEELNATNDD
jgi:hypothetical protein